MKSADEGRHVMADRGRRILTAGTQTFHEFGDRGWCLEQLPDGGTHRVQTEVAGAVEIEQDRPLVAELAVDDASTASDRCTTRQCLAQ